MSTDATAKRRWSKWDYLFVLTIAALVIFGWSVPNDLLPNSPRLQALCDFMARWNPQINRVTELGGETHGQICRLVFSVWWAVIIATVWIVVALAVRRARKDGFAESPQTQIPASMLLFGPLGGICIWWFSTFLPITDTRPQLVQLFLDRFWIGVNAPIMTFGSVLGLLSPFVCLWIAIKHPDSINYD